MIFWLLVVLAGFASAGAPALSQLHRVDRSGELSGPLMDGDREHDPHAVPADARLRRAQELDPPAPRPPRRVDARIERTPQDGPPRKGLPSWAIYGGAALIGGLQGLLTAGLFGAVGGAALGLASAHLWQKGNYGAAFGVTLGSIVGGFMLGGPVGAIVGGVLGGLAGHFIGKLFG